MGVEEGSLRGSSIAPSTPGRKPTKAEPAATRMRATSGTYRNHMLRHGVPGPEPPYHQRRVSLLELTTREEADTTVLGLAGELDISSGPRVEAELARAEERSPARLVLDLSHLEFMDSTGLRIVVSADARARERGARLVIVRGPDPVQRIFRVTRLEERLEMVDSPGAASG